MHALRVTLNGVVTTIALKNRGVLNATVMVNDSPRMDSEEVYLNLGGLDSLLNEHSTWPDTVLKTGDEVKIEVLAHCAGDPPVQTYKNDPGESEERSKNYLRKKAKELGWTIDESGAE